MALKDIPQINLNSAKKKVESVDVEVPQIKPGAAAKKTNFFKKILKLPLPKRKGQTASTKKQIIIRRVLIGVGVAVLVFALALAIPSYLVYKKAKKFVARAQTLKNAVTEEQNVVRIKEEIGNTKKELASLQKTYKYLSWVKVVPFLGNYVKDGEAAIAASVYGMDTAEVFVATIEPYADIIGFTGDPSKEAQSGEENANDRIEFIVQTSSEIIPKLEEISEKMDKARLELNKIDPNRYPEKLRGKEIRNQIKDGLVMVEQGAKMISDAKPLLEQAPYLLGVDEQRTYLVIFQNDKELRPTGGFITAYSIMRVENGKVSPVSSNDIYNLDSRYTPSVPAPDPIVDYLKGPYTLSKKLRLRDMNFSPDFAESMALFTEEAESAGITGIDGVIGVDTQVLVKLLDVIGQIGVPGFGNFSTEIIPECDCPQVIYELESFADIEGPVVWDQLDPTKIIYAPPNYDNRKKIVGPLMNSILSNALGQPKEKLPDLFQAAFESLLEKHVLLYLFEEEAQSAAQVFNIAGKIEDFEGDYLHINDANLGGRKSNLYVTQEVVQEIEIKRDKSIEKTLTITYNNPQDYDGWLNSVLPNWTRIYVPKGSELIDINGFEDKAEPYEEFDKTVFAGGFELRPKGLVKIEVKYKLPFKANELPGGEKGVYKLLVQKQPGLDSPLYSISIGKSSDELFLKTDKEFRFRI